MTARRPTRSAAAWVPEHPTLESARQAAAACRGCDLYRRATQTVFGEGSPRALVLFVGEQPGNAEDLAGHPFVGPAGRVLDGALEEAGIDRSRVWITNAVKHFKWEARGKLRIHKKPNQTEVGACRPWLDAEIALVRPRVIVCLGATAAQALLGAGFRVSRERGVPMPGSMAKTSAGAEWILATVHPSSILRAPDDESRREALQGFTEDMRVVARLLESARMTRDEAGAHPGA